MAAAAPDLTFTEEDIAGSDVLVAERDGALVGMVAVEDRQARLGWLFVEPAAIGSGVGSALLKAALARAAERGVSALELDSDPHAESFYRAHGARRIGTAPARSTGRALPRLRIPTGEARDARRPPTEKSI
jgi:GNAT superfamily N-acetyltransferase